MKVVVLGAIVLMFMAASIVAGQSKDPSDAVFMLLTTDRNAQNGKVNDQGFGTAFFISKDGTALTAGHVVSLVAKEPKKYRMVAIVGKEFYDTELICATIPNMGTDETHMTRDIAKIKLIPSTAYDGTKETLFYFPKKGDPIPLATAHRGPLPEFPYLTIDGAAKGHVRVIGFGNISAIPHVWTADERVENLYGALSWPEDNTPFFGLYSDSPATNGDSGGPVINDQNQVVGMMTLGAADDRRHGAAEGSSVLLHPCQ